MSSVGCENGAVLVCGGAGFIGAHVCKELRSNGFLPISLDNLSSGHRHNVLWGPLLHEDISDYNRVRQIVEKYSIKTAIILAGSIEVSIGQKDPQSFYRNNVANAIELVSALRDGGITAIIFSSTAAVYGCPTYTPIDEQHETCPTNVYGRTKLIFEHVLEDFARAYELSISCLRYFNAAGADLDGEVGEEHEPETHLIPNALFAAREAKTLSVFGHDYDTPDGTAIRDYVHVSDLASAHVAVIPVIANRKQLLTLNLGAGQGYSVLEVVEAVRKITKRKLNVSFGARREGDVPILTADITKARAEIGFKPERSTLETIIGSANDFFSTKRRRWAAQQSQQ